MKATEALTRSLRSRARLYDETGDGVSINLKEVTNPEHHGGTAGINPSSNAVSINAEIATYLERKDLRNTAVENRLIRDMLNHEIEHKNESDLEDKHRITQEYADRGLGNLAGYVWNLLEDAHIDYTRTQKRRGIADARAQKIKLMLESQGTDVSELETQAAVHKGLWQLCKAGGVVGFENADETVRDMLAELRPFVFQARYANDPEDRYSVACEVTDLLAEFADEAPEDETPIDQLADPEQADAENGPEFDPETSTPFSPDADEGEDADEETEGDESEQGGGGDTDDEGEGEQSGDGSDGDHGDDTDAESDGGKGDTGESGDGDESGSGAGVGEGDEHAEHKTELDSWSPDQLAEWCNANPESYDDLSEREERRFAELMDEAEAEKTRLGNDMKRRDSYMSSTPELSHEDVALELRQSGLEDEIIDAFTALKTGSRSRPSTRGNRLNMRNVIRHSAGDMSETRFYERRQNIETGDRSISVTLDMSGSMGYEVDGEDMLGERQAKIACMALARAAEIIGDEFMASSFHNTASLITSPTERFEPEHMDAVGNGGGTNLYTGIRMAKRLLEESNPRNDHVLIAVTDGRTSCIDETVAEIEDAREKGIKVIGFGAGGVTASDMADVFGADGYVMVDMKNLADAIIDVYHGMMDVTQLRR